MDQSAIDVLRKKHIADQAMLIDGQDIISVDGFALDVVSPIDGQVISTIPQASVENVDAAVSAARKAQKGVPNPFRPGETMDVAARPASVQVKVRPLKKLKDMAS